MRILKLPQLVKYYSPLLDEEALAVNILFQDYDKFSMNYVFPPPVMIELVLNRIYLPDSVSSDYSVETPTNMASKGSSSFSKASLQVTNQSKIGARPSSINMSSSHILFENNEVKNLRKERNLKIEKLYESGDMYTA